MFGSVDLCVQLKALVQAKGDYTSRNESHAAHKATSAGSQVTASK
jgi:hypothetical protein